MQTVVPHLEKETELDLVVICVFVEQNIAQNLRGCRGFSLILMY